MLEVALESAGFRVAVAYTCGQAKELLETQSFDALVADLTLPDGSSTDLLESLGTKRPRVAVVLSGSDEPDDMDRTEAVGFDAHLVKPTSIEKLVDVIGRGLDSSRGRSGARPGIRRPERRGRRFPG